MTACVRCGVNEANAWAETDWYSGEEPLCVRCAEEDLDGWRRRQAALADYRESGSERADHAGQTYQGVY